MKKQFPILFLIFILFISLLIGCKNSIENNSRPFEYFFDFKTEIERLTKENPIILKTVARNNISQTILDTIDWENEFSFFLKSDINHPRFKDGYEISMEENGDKKKVTYSAKESQFSVRLMEFSYQKNDLKEIHILYEENNFITKSKYELRYNPSDFYTISGYQSVPFLYEENFKVNGNFHFPKEGKWRTVLQIKNETLNEEIPFIQLLKFENGKWYAEIENAEEKIKCSEVSLLGDSFFIKLPVFDSELKGKIIADTLIKGAWFNYSKGIDYVIPFYSEYNKTFRFASQGNEQALSPKSISGKWEAEFSKGTKDYYKAIGIFNQEGTKVSGTVLTETGDYRFLDGNYINDSLMLSCFDGSHAFLFMASVKNKNQMEGKFWSGIHWNEPWTAKRNENGQLSNPDSLTFLKEGYSNINFSFPNLDSQMVSASDNKYKNKVLVVQILGSWCPNCLDETTFFTEIYKSKHEKGLEIIGLAFERSADFNKARSSVKRFKEQLNAPFDFLIAGTASTANANKALPMLNHIMSFPTAIYIDRSGKVRKIHTGFYGPGTGDYYQKFREETNAFLDRLLLE